jgi:hypothetical protein
MGWSMDAQAASPAGAEAPTTLESPANAESPTGRETPAESPTGAEIPAGVETPVEEPRTPGFRERGRMRRRVRFLRKARELAYRDLGGLVFEMQRLGQRHDELVAAKLGVLAGFDGELRTLEAALGERWPITVLREAGIAACPRCAAIHGSDDRFCPACGMPLGRHADRPIATTPVAAAGTHPAAPAPPTAGTYPATPAPPAAAPPVAAAGTPTTVPGTPVTAPAPTAAGTHPATPTPPAAATHPAAPAPPAGGATAAPTASPTGSPATEEDQPTEIIRPQDDAR